MKARLYVKTQQAGKPAIAPRAETAEERAAREKFQRAGQDGGAKRHRKGET